MTIVKTKILPDNRIVQWTNFLLSGNIFVFMIVTQVQLLPVSQSTQQDKKQLWKCLAGREKGVKIKTVPEEKAVVVRLPFSCYI